MKEKQADKLFIVALQNVINNLNLIDDILDNNPDKQRDIDYKISDILHEIQNNEELTDTMYANLGKKLKELRKEREALKKIYDIGEEYKKNKNGLQDKEKRENFYNIIQTKLIQFNNEYNNRILSKEEIEEIETKKNSTYKNIQDKLHITIDLDKFKEEVEKGKSNAELEEIFNISHGTISKIRKELGLGRNRGKRNSVTNEEIKELLSLGYNQSEIARRFNMTQGGINQRIKKMREKGEL